MLMFLNFKKDPNTSKTDGKENKKNKDNQEIIFDDTKNKEQVIDFKLLIILVIATYFTSTLISSYLYDILKHSTYNISSLFSNISLNTF
jgi:hypothetical protein